MPDTIEFTEPQLPMKRSNLSDGFRCRLATFKEAEDSAQGILVNTFEELEPRYVEEYKKVKKIWKIKKAVEMVMDEGDEGGEEKKSQRAWRIGQESCQTRWFFLPEYDMVDSTRHASTGQSSMINPSYNF
ncbi:hypothetical protein Pint_09596 [Pistacia integerrima]|uniref:Uncharacterized protein n=1 Tax=Pistacia integerrima TaxID=434235 RepID=A0ACC0XM62_9ROSI|nr:hypothetical protein Pint_09596 [Pistacia integerrima]